MIRSRRLRGVPLERVCAKAPALHHASADARAIENSLRVGIKCVGLGEGVGSGNGPGCGLGVGVGCGRGDAATVLAILAVTLPMIVTTSP